MTLDEAGIRGMQMDYEKFLRSDGSEGAWGSVVVNDEFVKNFPALLALALEGLKTRKMREALERIIKHVEDHRRSLEQAEWDKLNGIPSSVLRLCADSIARAANTPPAVAGERGGG